MKKGFTLIELLAVLVVITIISLISVPIILNVIESSRRGAFESTSYGLLEAATIFYANETSEGLEDSYTFSFDGGKLGETVDGDKLDYKGKAPTSGYIVLYENGKTEANISNGTYNICKAKTESKVRLYDAELETCALNEDGTVSTDGTSLNSSPGELVLNIKNYNLESDIPATAKESDIAFVSDTKATSYFTSSLAPTTPVDGDVWISVSAYFDRYISSEYNKIPIAHVSQYNEGEWQPKEAYIYNDGTWKDLVSAADLGLIQNFAYTGTNNYTGTSQSFTAPYTGYYQLQTWGAGGGAGNTAPGGKGGYASGIYHMQAGETVYIYVGGYGGPNCVTSYTAANCFGGYNGGGNSYYWTAMANGEYVWAGAGGGATHIAKRNNLLKDLVDYKTTILIVAGGGGGGIYHNNPTTPWYGNGGAGGGLDGIYVLNSHNAGFFGKGGTQTEGGASSNWLPGSFGLGSSSTGSYGSGGGAGFFGGGAGYASGGGGGSSYIGGVVSRGGITAETIAGNASLPALTGGTETGHQGNGYARITFIEIG